MDELVEFLNAQLDEDERVAVTTLNINIRVAVKRGKAVPRWLPKPESSGIWDENGIQRVAHTWVREREHICRHDPARLLADVAADRAVIAEAERIRQSANAYQNAANMAAWMAMERVLRIRVQRYSSHPDYDPAWSVAL